MRETSGPPMGPLPPDTNLLEPVIQRAEKEPGRVMAAYRDGDDFVDVTAGAVLRTLPGHSQGHRRQWARARRSSCSHVADEAGVAAARLRHPRQLAV